MDIIIPKIQSKYITAFKNESSYDAAYPTFEEVNWSAIKPAVGPEELPDEYRLSRRLSHMYANGTPPDYKFSSVDEYVPYDAQTEKEKTYADAHQIAHHNIEGCPANRMTPDDIRKTFFLEIVWGYSGWEWHDYETVVDRGDVQAATFKLYDRDLYMGLSSEGVILTSQPTVLTVENNEDGTVYLTDGTYYVGLKGSDVYTMDSAPAKKVALTFEYKIIDDEVYVYLLNPNGYVGNDPSIEGDDGKCWADKAKADFSTWKMNVTQGTPATVEILKGGNLYRIKNIETVPHIIDGHRLQHINDFLFSQYNVTRVEGFNTTNLVAANRAFKRGTNFDTSYPKRRISEVVPMVLIDAVDADNNLLDYYFGYADETNDYYTLPKLVEADGLFYNNYVFVKDEPFNAEPIVIPNIKSIDRLYAYGFFTEGLKFKFNKLEKLTRSFMGACFYNSSLNLNDVFIGDTLKKVTDFSYMLGGVSFIGWIEGTNHNMEISLDLISSTVDANDVINLSHFVEWAGTKENGNDYSVTSDSGISVDLNFNNKVNLDYAFSYLIGTKPRNTYYGDDTHNYHRVGSFERMSLNFNSKENYITSIVGGLKNNTFTETPPITQVPNNACDDSSIYQGCTFNVPVSYNFLNGAIASPREQGYGQFNDCTINDSYTFSNIQGLDRVEFCGIKFGNDVSAANRTFPYVVQDQNDTTYRFFDIANSKFMGTLPAQNIYIDSARLALAKGGRLNSFTGCSELTDLSNIHLYYSDIDARQGYPEGITSSTSFGLNFSGCTNMTKTPYIHLLFYRYGQMYLPISFKGLKNLTEVNFENFSLGCTSTVTGISFQDCTSLVTLKFANNMADGWSGNVDLRGCTSLDINALKAALIKDSVTNMGGLRKGKVYFLESTWRAVNDMSPSSTEPISGPVKTYFDSNGINYNYTPDATYHEGDPQPN